MCIICYNFGLFNSEPCKRSGIEVLCLFRDLRTNTKREETSIQMQQQTNVNRSESVSIC